MRDPHTPIPPDAGALARMRECMVLDEQGNVLWRKKPSSSRSASAIAGWRDRHGYLCVRFGPRLIFAHHIAWYLSRGAWPVSSVDHINGIAGDNRPSNLREASHAQNMKNRKPPRKASNLPFGVTLHKLTGKYRAKIRSDGRDICLGLHATADEAARARILGEIKHHGAFAAHHGAQAMETYNS